MLTGRHPEVGILSPDEEKLAQIRVFAQTVTRSIQTPAAPR